MPGIKREAVTTRLNTDIVESAREFSRTEYGGRDKLGLLIEDALQFYIANKTDETRATALLQILEKSLFTRISAEIEGMHKEFTKRDNSLEKRLANLMAVSSYESCLSEQMLKEALFSQDKKTKARYEELRSAAARQMKMDVDTDAGPLARELEEQVGDLQAHYKKMRVAIATRDQTIKWCQKNLNESANTKEAPTWKYRLTDFPELGD